MGGVSGADNGHMREEEGAKDQPAAAVAYSWFLEYPNGTGVEGTNSSGIPNYSRPGALEAPRSSHQEQQFRNLLYLNQAGIWVKFHDYASNVDLLLGEEALINSTGGECGDKRVVEAGGGEHKSSDSEGRVLPLNSLRRDGRKDGGGGGGWLLHSFFQSVSQDWFLGWGFICDYFREFILN